MVSFSCTFDITLTGGFCEECTIGLAAALVVPFAKGEVPNGDFFLSKSGVEGVGLSFCLDV